MFSFAWSSVRAFEPDCAAPLHAAGHLSLSLSLSLSLPLSLALAVSVSEAGAGDAESVGARLSHTAQ